MNNKEIKTEEFASLVFDAVYEERYLSRELLVPKIKTLAKMYRLKLQTDNFNTIENPTKMAGLMISMMQKSEELVFWRGKIRALVDDKELNIMFDELNNHLIKCGFKNKNHDK